MAPIPSGIDNETNALILDLQRRQKDMSDFQLGRLRGCRESIAVQQRFANEMKEDLDFFERQTETLGIACEDLERKSERDVVAQIAEEFKAFAMRIRKDMRAAILESKKAIDQQARSRRDELLKSTNSPKDKLDEKSTDDKLMQASNNVTDALRRTIGAMQGELERSVLSHQLLEKSTASLRSTSTQHDTLTTVMDTSKHIITALEKADWLDRLLILAGLMFFILVVLFILKQRILDRGLRVALWWTLFLPSQPKGVPPIVAVSSDSIERVSSSAVLETILDTVSTVSTTLSDALAATASAIMEGDELNAQSTTSTYGEVLGTVGPSVLEHVDL